MVRRDGYVVSYGYVNAEYYRRVRDEEAPSSIEINKLWNLCTVEAFLDKVEPAG